MVMMLLYVLAVVLVAGAVVFLIRQAPFIDEQYKQFGVWVVLVFAVIFLVMMLFGQFPDVRIGRPF